MGVNATLHQRYKGSWSIILDLGYQKDPETGKLKRKQKWFTVKGNKEAAEKKRIEILHECNTGQFLEPSNRTFGEWLDHWVETHIKPPMKRLRTYESYEGMIRCHIKPHLGGYLLQDLQATHLELYYAELATREKKPLSQTTLEHHHAVISGALKAAVNKDLVRRNVAKLVGNKPKAPEGTEDIRENCWNENEASRFLETAKSRGPQSAAFYSLALDSGMRKGELCGLRWANVDLKNSKVAVVEQLIKPGANPIFGPPKRDRARTIHLSWQTVALLKAHKKQQNEMKMENRHHYQDHGLVFAKEWGQLTRKYHTLGHPLQMNNLGQREFGSIIEEAKVPTITFHGMRHTCGTLLLKFGEPVKVVSERLGHKGVEITMNIYQHVLPDMQEAAASTIGNILHGNS